MTFIDLIVMALKINEDPRREVADSFPECLFYVLDIACISVRCMICPFWITGCNGNGCKSKASSSGAEDCES